MACLAKAQMRSMAKAGAVRPAKPCVVRGAVKASATKPEQLAKKAAAAVASLPVLVASSPAFALVDDRLNGDGVGHPLGVNEPILGWVIGGVASLIWVLYFIAQRDFGDFEDKDSGVGL